MLKRTLYIFMFLLLACAYRGLGQCPINIGFDTGDFTNWDGFTGSYPGFGVMNILNTGIDENVHQIIARKSQLTDPYGNFPLVSPNGSNYIVKLGNDALTKVGGYGKAQRLSFTFTVPANNDKFSLIYYYALVIEDPVGLQGHTDDTKPRFTAAVYDVSGNKYTDCGNFDFVSIASLPNFVRAPVQTKAGDVFYKDWSPVTIDLRGLAGKTLRLEFTTTNCVPSGHFSYAYIDVNQNCSSPVAGNAKCPNSDGITLSAPAGFKEYYWYNEKDFSTVIGTTNTLTPVPTPPVGTGFSVRIVPYPGIGCPDTIYTTIQPTEYPIFVVKPQLQVCRTTKANIMDDKITQGTDPNLAGNGFVYYDESMTKIVPDPTNVPVGTYYIQATSNSGCTYLKQIVVSPLETPTLKITPPDPVCYPATVDITRPEITQGSLIADSLTYWRDVNATIPLINRTKIDSTNTFYIKATDAKSGCSDIQPVLVIIDRPPVLVTHTINGCNTADIRIPAATAGSSNFTTPFLYFLDSLATKPIADPGAITKTDKYYIQATNNYCTTIAKIQVNVSPYPQLTVVNPKAVKFPQTVDITRSFQSQKDVQYIYYSDSLGIKVVKDAAAVTRDGIYYIQAINQITGCSKTFPVKVTIYAPDDVNFAINTFTPNGDGNNDVFYFKTPSSIVVYRFSIYNSYGQLLFETTQANKGWDGTGPSGKRMPVATYYYIFEGFDNFTNQKLKKAGSVALIL